MPAALRYTFDFDDSNFRLMRRRPLDKRTAATEESNKGPESGFWIELRDAQQKVLYRRVMDDPALRSEGPINDEGDVRDEPNAPVRGRFSVVVPALPAARTLVIMASRPPETVAKPILTTTLEAV